MCGICGVVNWGGREAVTAMNSIQAHRGPDDSGLWDRTFPDRSYIGLGNRRLAIIDLSPAGHMPMSNAAGNLWITYNGEIYNFPELRQEAEAKGYRFRSNTDTEVILALYEREGATCLSRLNGMFAFAICDLRGREPIVFLARDHVGIKPLYYSHRGTQFAFASEMKALLQCPGMERQLDLRALHQYLTFLWVPEPNTILTNIHKLPPGHYASFQRGEFRVAQYWDLHLPAAQAEHSLARKEELAEAVRDQLIRSVRRQMISDVPIGAFLSAGMDSSSVVAAMAATAARPLRTYTITFPQKHRLGSGTLDDPGIPRRFAQQLGCEHHEMVIEPHVVDLLSKLVWHMDEPVADPAIIAAYLVCREARKTATVLLAGVGGDELFGGYRKYSAYYWAKTYQSIPWWLRRHVLERLILALPSGQGTHAQSWIRLAQKMARSASMTPEDAFLMNCTYLDDPQKRELYQRDVSESIGTFDPWRSHREHFSRVEHADFLDQMMYVDVKAFLVSLNLGYTDKMSMASSLEARVPFLDRELMEFVAANVPPSMKVRGFGSRTKYILRKAMRGLLPEEVLIQKKAGFGAPVEYWLANDLRPMIDELLSEERIRRSGLFRPEAVRKMVVEQRSGRRNWSMQVWQLLTLELWLEAFRPAVKAPLPTAVCVAGT